MAQNFARSTQIHFMIAFAGVFAVAAYVLFGDSFQPVTPIKKKRKRGGLPGLINIGNSCFINCILQALASSVAYNKWLAIQNSKYAKKLFIAVRDVLEKLNGETDEDTTALEVLSALKDQKLFLTAGEQDAHELFIALISAVNDELTNAEKESSSLLEIGWAAQTNNQQSLQVAEAQLLEAANETNKSSYIDQVSDINSACSVVISEQESLPIKHTTEAETSPKNGRIVTRVSTSLNQEAQHSKRLGQSDCPFSGSLASQLQCMFCGCKNPDQWTPFHAISLCFPTPQSGMLPFKLEDLLEIYVKKEIIELNCENCSKNCNTRFSKQLTFGKLPESLCIHIQRNVWTGTGSTIKLKDHVVVPEIIDMEPFTYSNNLRKQQKLETVINKPNNMSCQPISINEALHAFTSMQSELLGESDSFRNSNFYKLQAVVVHVGDSHSGHFVTYRRGSVNSTFRNRWFYTSDSIVTEVSLEQVLNSSAYMILYEKLL